MTHEGDAPNTYFAVISKFSTMFTDYFYNWTKLKHIILYKIVYFQPWLA